MVVAASAASASSLTYSPFPVVAGEPIQVTYTSVAQYCEPNQFIEETSRNEFGQIFLRVTPPGCAIPLLYWAPRHYTVSTVIAPLAAGDYELHVFQVPFGSEAIEPLRVLPPPACRTAEDMLCLGGGRFEVTARWTDFRANSGVARSVPQTSLEFGAMWFFSPANPELLVKVLDGCALNAHYWVFASPATTVSYTVTVRDVVRGTTRSYAHPARSAPQLTSDTGAFPCD